MKNITGINSTEKISAGILRIKNATQDSGGLYECLLSYQWNNTLFNISKTNKISLESSSETLIFSRVHIIVLAIGVIFSIFIFFVTFSYAYNLIYKKLGARQISSSKYEGL